MPAHYFHGKIERLEIASGHDGFLRGGPDPVLLVGVYITDGSSLRILGRSVHRFAARAPFPSNASADQSGLAVGVLEVSTSFFYVGLAIAIEEDGGKDVQRLYGALEHHAKLTVWKADASEIEPLPLSSVARTPPWYAPTPIELVVDGAPAAESCRSDKFIGAVCWAMPPRPDAPVSLYRLPFLAANRKNDWTAVLAVGH